MRELFAIGLGAAVITRAAHGQLHATDIVLGVEDGAIVTGTVGSGGTPAYPWFVFLGTFGDLGPGFENYTPDPGFDSPAVFPSGTKVGFDILKALRAWDGAAFGPIPAETIVIAKGGLSAQSPRGDTPVAGFVIGEANSVGKFHHHVGYSISEPFGDGIYLLELRLWSPSLDSSGPFWIVFNQNRPEAEHQAAAAWVLANLAAECEPDCEGDGDLDIFDFLCFQGKFATGDPYGDYEGDGDWDIFDFLAFQGSFAVGC